MGGINIATGIIILANVLFSIKGFEDFSFFEKFKFNIAGLKRGEKIRMISSGFLHADYSHLFFNMLTLYFFADIVIIYLGIAGFVVIYIASLLVGNLLSFYFHKNEYHYSAIGASGAVMGVLYSSILFAPFMQFYGFVPAWLFGILYLMFSIYGMKNKVGNVGHDAHFGGAIAGYVLTIAFAPWLLEEQLWIVIALAIPILILFALIKLGKI